MKQIIVNYLLLTSILLGISNYVVYSNDPENYSVRKIESKMSPGYRNKTHSMPLQQELDRCGKIKKKSCNKNLDQSFLG